MNASELGYPKMKNGSEPNIYQIAIADWMEYGEGNAVVNAVAGSGKTSLLVWLATFFVKTTGLFVAFNNSIAKELSKKLYGTGMLTKTIHSTGYGLLSQHLGKLDVDKDGKKYREIAKELVAERNVEMTKRKDEVNKLVKLCSLVRLTLTDPNNQEALYDLINRFDLEPGDYLEDVAPAIAKGNTQARQRNYIDFDDMIYLPVIWKLQPPKYKWVFVDECQDLNACQLSLVMRFVDPEEGRMLFVGDRNQAIYGFAGADARAFNKIIERTNAIELPLSVCYRCPTSHLELAKAIVPHIKPAPGAKAGNVAWEDEEKLPTLVTAKDLILSRTTAPLVTWCIRLIRQQIPATVRGREIGKYLTGTLKSIAKAPGFEFGKVIEYLELYRAEQTRFLEQREADPSAFEALNDKVDTLLACSEEFHATDLAELCKKIEALFSDKGEGVEFCTVHRAKGLENERIWIIEPQKLPLVWPGQQDWQLEQEFNLKYVALTRSKEHLGFFVKKEG